MCFSVFDILMGGDDVHQWGFLPPTEAPSLYTQDQRDDHWRHFDKSVNAISFGFVATAILISMFLVMAIFERFLRTTSPVDGGGGGRNASGGVDSQVGFNSKLDHSSLKVSYHFTNYGTRILLFQVFISTFLENPR